MGCVSGCRFKTPPPPIVEVVLCRFEENVSWTVGAFRRRERVALVVYNAGRAAELPYGVVQRSIPNHGREAGCILRHLLAQKSRAHERGAEALPNFTLFAQARPKSQSRLVEAARALAAARTHPTPRGFAPMGGDAMNWGWSGDRARFCWDQQWSNMTGLPRRLFREYQDRLTYTPAAEFAVARRNVLAAPSWVLQHALVALDASEPLPWDANSPQVLALPFSTSGRRVDRDSGYFCCAFSCIPWILERLWEVLLTLPEVELEPDGVQRRRPAARRSTGGVADGERTILVEVAHRRRAPRESAGEAEMRRRFDVNVATLCQRFLADGPGGAWRAAFVDAMEDAPLIERIVAGTNFNMTAWHPKLLRMLHRTLPMSRYESLPPSRVCLGLLTERLPDLRRSVPRLQPHWGSSRQVLARSSVSALPAPSEAPGVPSEQSVREHDLRQALRVFYARCVHHQHRRAIG